MSGKDSGHNPAGAVNTTSRLTDVIAGASLGALMGVLVGLSASPVVSSVVTGLAALLAGFFGLSEKLTKGLPEAAGRRIAAFGLAAVLAAALGVLTRTHDWLAPSVSSQRASLAEIGINDPKEQNEMLRFVRFGVIPAGTSVVPKDSVAAGIVADRRPVLFSASSDFCTSFLRLTNLKDMLTLMDQQTKDIQEVANVIRGLPDDQQDATLKLGRIYLCKVR
jgi:hypothetical protein